MCTHTCKHKECVCVRMRKREATHAKAFSWRLADIRSHLQVKKSTIYPMYSITHIWTNSLCSHMMQSTDRQNIRFLKCPGPFINFLVTYRFNTEHE